MKHLAAVAAVVALALLALLEPAAAAGLKFSANDLKSEKSLSRLYNLWAKHFNVVRKPVERQRRFGTFNQTAHRVASRARVAGVAPRLNIFADVTSEEFRAFECHSPPSEHSNLVTAAPVKRRRDVPLPVAVDWRSRMCQGQPCLSPVKYQGWCGACWAFAATSALESHRAIARENNDELLSEQELVDCDSSSSGCKGGTALNGFLYAMKNGLASSDDYPYVAASNGTCIASEKPRVNMRVRAVMQLPANDEFQLLSAVVDGPVAVSLAIEDKNDPFQEYTGGLYVDKCGGARAGRHAMLLVGYGSYYYVLKNSYGASWGDDGYMFLPRNRSCGILDRGGTYPEIGA